LTRGGCRSQRQSLHSGVEWAVWALTPTLGPWQKQQSRSSGYRELQISFNGVVILGTLRVRYSFGCFFRLAFASIALLVLFLRHFLFEELRKDVHDFFTIHTLGLLLINVGQEQRLGTGGGTETFGEQFGL
jgi:hypothetical protein